MGLFGKSRKLPEITENLFELKNNLTSSELWLESYENPEIWRDGFRLGFANVDCRRCGGTEASVIVNQQLSNSISLVVSFAPCTEEPTVWVSEVQGYARSKEEWLNGPWSKFDERDGSVTEMIQNGFVGSTNFDSIEDWVMTTFISWARVLETKNSRADALAIFGVSSDRA